MAPSLVDLLNPAHIDVNSTFLKHSFKPWVWNPHLSLTISNSDAMADLQKNLATFTTELHVPLAQDLKKLKDLVGAGRREWVQVYEGRKVPIQSSYPFHWEQSAATSVMEVIQCNQSAPRWLASSSFPHYCPQGMVPYQDLAWVSTGGRLGLSSSYSQISVVRRNTCCDPYINFIPV